MRKLPGLVLWFALPLIASCVRPATEGGFDSPNPAARLYAIEQAARAGDGSALAQLVEQLDSDDVAVRFLAISALGRLTGRTFDYRHYDAPIQREAAIRRWVEYLEAHPPPAPSDGPERGAKQHG